ncbi:uncharacterized protein C2orf72 homolog [Gastrophryne carolinensis]
MARDSTERRFQEVLERFGGPHSVQLVGELWERAESRTLLETFLRELFPDTAAALRSDDGGQEKAQQCKPDSPQRPPPKPERTLGFGLVFFVCRPDSLLQKRSRRELREILRDVRERMPAGGAVIGVIMQPDGRNGQQEISGGQQEISGGQQEVTASLLALLHAVFPLKRRPKLCSEVRAALLLPGQEDTRRDIQSLACEAITAADELRKLKPKVKPFCFSWRKRRWQEYVLKDAFTHSVFRAHIKVIAMVFPQS